MQLANPKWTSFQTPTGATGNLLSPSSWVSMILGVIVFLLTLGLGQHVVQRAQSRLPQTKLEPFVSTPASSAPGKKIY